MILHLASLAVVLIGGLKLMEAGKPMTPHVELLGIAPPSRLGPAEHARIVAGITLATGTFEISTSMRSGGECRRKSWLRLTGPGTFWRFLGTEVASTGQGSVVLCLYALTSPVGGPVARWSQHVSVK